MPATLPANLILIADSYYSYIYDCDEIRVSGIDRH